MLLQSCTSTDTKSLKPPKAKKIEKKLIQHDDTRIDPYFWIREKENPEVISYLEEENSYTKAKLAPIKNLRQKIFSEMKGRIKKDDSTVPYKTDDYFYNIKFEPNSEYKIIVRRKHNLSAKEEIVLDTNLLAKGKSFFRLGSWSVNPDHKILAYSTDYKGNRVYTIHFKDLETGKTLEQKIENVTSNIRWAEDGKTLFYNKQDPKTLRKKWIYRYNIEIKKHGLVYTEEDNKYSTYVSKSKSKKYILIGSYSKESSELQLIDAKKPWTKPRIFQKRQPKHEYSIDHAGKFFFVTSNKAAKNFKVFRTPDEKNTGIKNWKTFIPHRKSVLIEYIDVFKNYLILNVRKNGVKEIEILERRSGKKYTMHQPEKSHVVYSSRNSDFNTDFLRYSYQSMTTPSSIIDYDFKSKVKTVRKTQEVLGDFDSKNYSSERIHATAKDGTQIPISIVYKRGTKKNGSAPLLLYGYGSYGASMEPWFSNTRLSLLDRGFIYAVAHIRGGSEMGRHWYDDGKFLKKKNTFTDFIAAADHLLKENYTSKNKFFAMGGSAGGLLMGAVINLRPSLFHGVVAQVPFVDVVSTMLDESIPLTTGEFEEWGNPKDKIYYEYMKSYSPYDNIKRANYPHMLVSSGLHDSQVQYWEPTKWVAKLRDLKTGNNLLLLDTNMEAGHGGKSGRFKKLEDRARDYAFLLHLAGIKE